MFFPPCVAFCGIVDVVLSNQRYPVELTHGVGPFSNAIRVPFQMLDTEGQPTQEDCTSQSMPSVAVSKRQVRERS